MTVAGVVRWPLGGLLTMPGLLYFYWGLGGAWLKDKSSPVVGGKPLVKLTRVQCFAAALGMFMLAATPVISMRPLLRECLLAGMTVIFAARAVGDFKYVGFFKTVKDSPFAVWDTKVYLPLNLVISGLAGYLVFSQFFPGQVSY